MPDALDPALPHGLAPEEIARDEASAADAPFDPVWYAQAYPDVALSGLAPDVHYAEAGRLMGRRPGPVPPLAAAADALKGRGLSVVVPVHGAPAEVEACLAALIAHTPRGVRRIVIDDASPGGEIEPLLARFAAAGGIEHHRNPRNLGFTATVNRGIRLAGRDDVILLNSDTEVPRGWAMRLWLAAHAAPDIGTVTAVSNAAGPFSVPEGPGPVTSEAAARIAAVLARGMPRAGIDAPTGHGFCLLVRRDCLDAAGPLDAAAFPRGYGEENEFCQRALALGWRSVIDPTTYVRHAVGASFGAAKADLLAAGRAVVDARHPGYTPAVRAFVKGPELEAMRADAARALAGETPLDADRAPRVLFVLPRLGAQGGTPQTNADLMAALGPGIRPLLMVSDGETLELSDPGTGEVLETAALPARLPPFPHRSDAYDAAILDWCLRYGVGLVHMRHLGGQSLSAPARLKAAGIPLVFSFHDFYALCPTVKLIDAEGRFCGGPCTEGAEDCRADFFKAPLGARLRGQAIMPWTENAAAALGHADALVTTSESARALVRRVLPSLARTPFHVIPHGRDFARMRAPAPGWDGSRPLRILVPGGITPAKGGLLLHDLARRLEGRVELHLLGKTSRAVGEVPGLVDHGPYAREAFVARVAGLDPPPDIAAVLSIWPETHCHTLTESWAAGLPVLGVDIGAVGERIGATGAGWHAAAPTGEAVVAALEAILDDPEGLAARARAVADWQAGEGAARSNAWMAGRYAELYADLMEA